MTPVKNQKDYNRIFRKVLFQVLIDPSRSKLFNDICEEKGRSDKRLKNLSTNPNIS